MEKYPKIQTVFKRDMSNKGRIIEDKYSLPEIEYLKDNKWVYTEKVDGTNIRVSLKNGILQIGGRTDNAQIPAFLLEILQRKITVEKLEQIFPDENNFCLYGEGYGARIQKGGGNYKSDGVDFVLFDVMIDGWWLKRDSIEDIAAQLNIAVVPIIGSGRLHDAVEIARQGLKSNWGDFPAEGIVMKPEIELKTRAGNRIITKIKHKDFEN